ncbi:MAG: 50S ribosomal protein L18e [archaeon]
MVKSGPTNPITIETARLLRKTKAPVWRRAAELLEKRTRQKVEVNLVEISRTVSKDKKISTIVVPGKVLGTGELSAKLNVAAQSASKSAVEKITRAGGSFSTLSELAKENPKGKNLRLIV